MKIRIKIDKITIEHPSDIYEIMKMVLKREQKIDRNKEHFWVLALSDASKILSLELVALGANNRVHARPADILAIPLQKQAKGVVLIHNHPAGTLEPSEEDKDFTDKMIQACRLVNTPVLDHVIITENSYLSFKETGLLERLEASNKYVLPYELEKQYHEEAQAAIQEVEKESKRKIKASLQKGRQEGERKGIEVGKAEGMQQGIEQEKLEIAKQMLSKGLDMQLICEMTGLSIEKLEQLLRLTP